VSTRMSKEEREAFLADVHVGVLSIAREGLAPLTVPVWYSYTPGGEVHMVTGGNTRKAQAIRKSGKGSLCVQDENPPYRYVSVSGVVTASDAADVERDLRPLARRYLGLQGGDQWVEQNEGSSTDEEDILIRLRPQSWLSADFGKGA
jgi:PPOX class probable F420-dependent enzyme